jgi:hypothetical protein
VSPHYVLIDFENVQPKALEQLAAEHFRLLVFVGAGQTKLPYEVAAAVQRLGPRAQYVKISGNGSNALDFHIAYYIGAIAVEDPKAHFHIISKDTGFDPLIKHLKEKKIQVARSASLTFLAPPTPAAASAGAKHGGDRVQVVLANLVQRKAGRPRTVKTLASTIASLFQKQVSADEVTGLVAELERLGYLSVDGTKVSYSLPG